MTRRGCILLVEDSTRDAELILDVLKGSHLPNEIIHVRDGADALDYLYRRGLFAARPEDQPSLLLLDLKLPKVDGLEVLRQIKGDPVLKIMPVVMMTSSRQESDLVESYRLGVNAYVVKPLIFQEFIDAVSQLSEFWTGLNEVPDNPSSSGPGADPATMVNGETA